MSMAMDALRAVTEALLRERVNRQLRKSVLVVLASLDNLVNQTAQMNAEQALETARGIIWHVSTHNGNPIPPRDRAVLATYINTCRI